MDEKDFDDMQEADTCVCMSCGLVCSIDWLYPGGKICPECSSNYVKWDISGEEKDKLDKEDKLHDDY